MKRILLKSLATCYIFLTFSCLSPIHDEQQLDNQAEALYATTFPIEFNKEISLSLNPPSSEYKVGEIIYAIVSNNTLDCIEFTNDFGNKMFMCLQGAWTEVPNQVNYIPDSKIISLPKPDVMSSKIVFFVPDLKEFQVSRPYIIRIMVIGKLCVDGTPNGSYVGAFTDAKVIP